MNQLVVLKTLQINYILIPKLFKVVVFENS